MQYSTLQDITVNAVEYNSKYIVSQVENYLY